MWLYNPHIIYILKYYDNGTLVVVTQKCSWAQHLKIIDKNNCVKIRLVYKPNLQFLFLILKNPNQTKAADRKTRYSMSRK